MNALACVLSQDRIIPRIESSYLLKVFGVGRGEPSPYVNMRPFLAFIQKSGQLRVVARRNGRRGYCVIGHMLVSHGTVLCMLLKLQGRYYINHTSIISSA